MKILNDNESQSTSFFSEKQTKKMFIFFRTVLASQGTLVWVNPAQR